MNPVAGCLPPSRFDDHLLASTRLIASGGEPFTAVRHRVHMETTAPQEAVREPRVASLRVDRARVDHGLRRRRSCEC